MKKKMAAVLLAAGLSVVASMTAFAGEWKTDSIGRWYQNDDGSYTTNNWQLIKDDDGVERWYLFDENGYIRTGMYQVNGYAYLLSTDTMTKASEMFAYFGDTYTGENDYTSQFGLTNNHPGAMVTGWFENYGEWRFFNDGSAADIPEGAMLINTTVTIDGTPQTLDENGLWVHG